MNEINLLQLFTSLLPAAIVGTLAFYFFKMHVANEEKRRRFLLRRENQNSALPLRLQAYERMTLFLERISMGKILLRIKPSNLDKEEYGRLLAQTIDQEFEHNLAQQIYMSAECWNVIKTAKNATIGIIRKTGLRDNIDSAEKLREVILTNLMDQAAPTDAALEFVKKEVRNII
jgi:hypothetical protein